MAVIRLEANGSVHGGTSLFVLVDAGSDAEKLWRSQGYLPEGEITADLEALREQWRAMNPGREPDKRWGIARLTVELQKVPEAGA